MNKKEETRSKKQEDQSSVLSSQSSVPDPVEAALRHKAAQVRPNPTFVNRLAARLRAARGAQSTARWRIPVWGWASAAVAMLLVVTLVIQAVWPRGVPVAPTGETPGVIGTTPVETTGPATATTGPSATPPPTPERKPDFAESLPPAVATAIPRPGEEVNTKAGVLVRFTQPMDRASVEQAIRVTAEDGRAQPVEGEFTWENDQVVTFKPKGLASGVRYSVSVSPEARAANGLTLNRELVFAFSTVGPLTVTHTSPADGVADVRGDAPILVAFNYPVVPLNCSGQVAESGSECPPLALDIQPGVVGQGLWVNTSVYRFDPLPAWNAGTAYNVTLPAGLQSMDGAELAAPVSFNFNTAAPDILAIEPGNGATDVPLETVITVTLNTPMDRATTEAAFALTDPLGAAIAGTFAWETDGAAFVFTPTQRLAYETGYTAALAPGAQTLSGAALADGESIFFNTTQPVRLSRIVPANNPNAQTLDYHEGVRVDFTGLVDPETVSDAIEVRRDGVVVSDANVYWTTYEKRPYAAVYWDKDAGAEYCVHILPGVADRYGNTLPDENYFRCFVVNDMPPIFASLVRQDTMTLDAAEAARLYMVAVNVAQVDLTLSTISERRFLAYADTIQPLGTVRTWSLTPGGARNASEIVPVDLTDSAPLPTGYYMLDWRTTPQRGEGWFPQMLRFAVVDRHLTLKLSDDEALVWVTDLRSGTPIAGADVVLLNQVGNELGRGVSDADGVARFAIPEQKDRWDTFAAVSGVAGQPGFGVVRSDWNANVSPWGFGINYDYGAGSQHQVYLHTDRPIYRPGQEVYFQGVVRRDDDELYSLPPVTLTLRVQVRTYSGISEFSLPEITLQPTEMGTFAGSFRLPEDAPLGSYDLALDILDPYTYNATWYAQFAVAAYRKPEFEVTVTPEQDDLLDGATLRALIAARYYSGGAVSNARVHWTLRAQPYTFAPDIAGWWSWDITISGWNYWRDAEPLAEGDATTDAQGNLLLDWPATLQPLGEQETTGPQTWELEVTVTDESGFPVTGRGSAVIHAGRFYLGLKPQKWVTAAGDPALVDVRSVDWDEQPFPNQPVTLSLARRAWKYIPSKQPFGEDLWTYEDTAIESVSVTTDGKGEAAASLTPPSSGSYVVLAESTDADGNVIRSETYLWVGGGGIAAWKLPEGRVTPVADAKSYRTGDVARILLPTPFEAPYEVLMTLERGSFLEVRRFTATEANPLIEIPLTDAHVPNVIVSFVVVKGIGGSADQRTPDVRIGMVELKVEPIKQLLTVEITPDCSPSPPPSPSP
ncbi:MAG TPA: Ig-like domain-containing protein, partial [Anaerolineae bacterium]|nr:Ig-like domain-containing protein [Anaerolineae bacterium]